MLVTNVSLRPPRAGIAADIAEAAEALDAPATGTVVFATLVDDPASVRETVDAFLGQIMVEAASAGATVNAGLAYATAVVEAVTVTELWSGAVPGIFAVAVAETAAAASAQDATVTSAVMAMSAMVPKVFVNSDGTLREAYAAGVMVNL